MACSPTWCHQLVPAEAGPPRDAAFVDLLDRSPLFVAGEQGNLVECPVRRVGAGGGMDVLRRVGGGRFCPSVQVVEALESVLRREREWPLLDKQFAACNAVAPERERLFAREESRPGATSEQTAGPTSRLSV